MIEKVLDGVQAVADTARELYENGLITDEEFEEVDYALWSAYQRIAQVRD